MAILEQLRKLNPELPFYSVLDPEFRAYGRVIDFDAASLIETCEKAAVMPESGSRQVLGEYVLPDGGRMRDFELNFRCPSLRT